MTGWGNMLRPEPENQEPRRLSSDYPLLLVGRAK